MSVILSDNSWDLETSGDTSEHKKGVVLNETRMDWWDA